MGRLPKLLFVVLCVCFLILIQTSAYAFETKRVAILPPIDTANYKSPDVTNIINSKLRDKLKYPYYELVMLPETLKTVNKDTLANIAQSRRVDAVIVIDIEELRSIVIQYDENSLDDSYITLKCYTYSTKTDELSIYRFSRHEAVTLTVFAGALSLVSQGMDEYLKMLKL